MICVEKQSTIGTARKLEIPLKTVEKWVTAYNKNPTCFNRADDYYVMEWRKFSGRYDKLDKESLISELKKRDLEISYWFSVAKAKELNEKSRLK